MIKVKILAMGGNDVTWRFLSVSKWRDKDFAISSGVGPTSDRSVFPNRKEVVNDLVKSCNSVAITCWILYTLINGDQGCS